MTASMHARHEEIRAKKGLGRWPVTPDMVAERKDREAVAKAEAKARRRAEMEAKLLQPAKNHTNLFAPRSGRKSANSVLPTDTVGGRIRNARLDCGASQAEIGRRISVGSGVVSYWEASQYVPSPENIKKLAKVLGVTEKWLAEGGK